MEAEVENWVGRSRGAGESAGESAGELERALESSRGRWRRELALAAAGS